MNEKGVSAFLAASLIILFGITSVTIVLVVVKPALDKAQDQFIINEGFSNLEVVDKTVKEVVSEEEGARRTITIKVTDGAYDVDRNRDYINFTFDLSSGFNISGKRGDVNISMSRDVITLFVVYSRVDLLGNTHFAKGTNQVLIAHNGINSTTNKTMVNITV